MVEKCQQHAFSYLRASSTIVYQPKILMRSGKTWAMSANIVSIIEKLVGWPRLSARRVRRGKPRPTDTG